MTISQPTQPSTPSRCYFSGNATCPGCDLAILNLIETAERVAQSINSPALKEAAQAVREKVFPEGATSDG